MIAPVWEIARYGIAADPKKPTHTPHYHSRGYVTRSRAGEDLENGPMDVQFLVVDEKMMIGISILLDPAMLMKMSSLKLGVFHQPN
jgi:hypothetical protein